MAYLRKVNQSELKYAQHSNDKLLPDSSKERYFYISLHGLSVESSNVEELNNNVSYIVSSDHGVETFCAIDVDKYIVKYLRRDDGHKRVKELFNGGLNMFVSKLSKEYVFVDHEGNEKKLHFTYRKLLYDIEFDFKLMFNYNPEGGGIFEIDERGISTGFKDWEKYQWRGSEILKYILEKAEKEKKSIKSLRLKLSEIISYLREKSGYETQKFHFLIISCRHTDGDIGLERTWSERETMCDKLGNCFKYITGREKYKTIKKKKKKKQYKKKKHTKKKKTLKRK
tara:strand:- start:215 stop:1063 length:849 start_codon:yes stop_codon:yes gene_type:complete